jgi:hypothetical protein
MTSQDNTKRSLNIHIEAASNGPVRIISGPHVEISGTDNSILTEFCFMAEREVMKKPTMYKHLLSILNTNIIIKLLNSLHTCKPSP